MQSSCVQPDGKPAAGSANLHVARLAGAGGGIGAEIFTETTWYHPPYPEVVIFSLFFPSFRRPRRALQSYGVKKVWVY